MLSHKTLTRNGYILTKKNIDSNKLNLIKQELEVKPQLHPDYAGDNDSFKLYKETDKTICVPRYYGETHFGKCSKKLGMTAKKINVTFNGNIRDEQKPIVDSCLNSIKQNGGGIISLPCGFGKTVLSINMACQLGLKTLVIVHKTFLQNQWYDRIKQFTNARIGTIRQKKTDVKDKDIVVGMLQSIAMIDYDPSIFKEFGTVIIDECFPAYILIVTDQGLFTISQLYKLWKNNSNVPLIKSYNETTKSFEFKKLTYAWKKYTNKLIRVHFNNQFIDCTPNHLFLTLDGYIEANKLTTNSILHGECGKYTVYSIEEIEVNTLNRSVYDIEVEDNHNFIVINDKSYSGIIVHNCHHTPSRVFSQALQKIGCQYTIGLSATPYRADGLTKILYWYLGELIYKIERKGDNKVLVKMFNYESNDKLFAEKKQWVKGKVTVSIPKMVTNMYKINDRNTFVINILNNLKNIEGRKILVLSARLDHLDILKNGIDAIIKLQIDKGELEINEYKTAYYVGGMKEYELIESAQADIIFATYAMAEEGLDIDSLNTLILATPKPDIVQSIGRIMRKPIKEGDIYPMIIDIVDQFSIFKRWGAKRKDYYDKKKYTVNEYVAYNKDCITIKDYLLMKKIPLTKLSSDFNIRKEYMCLTYGQYSYEDEEELEFEDHPLEKYNYAPNYDTIFNINYDYSNLENITEYVDKELVKEFIEEFNNNEPLSENIFERAKQLKDGKKIKIDI